VSWILEEKNGVIKDYHVTYVREDDSSDIKSRTTQETQLHFENLMEGKTYEFQVGKIWIRSLVKPFNTPASRYYLEVLCYESKQTSRQKQTNKQTIEAN